MNIKKIYRNIYVEAGADFSDTVNVIDYKTQTPINVSGYTDLVGQVKKTYLSENFLEFEFELDGNSKIIFKLDSAETGQLKPGRYVYDITIELNGNINKLIEGILEIYPTASIYV